MSKSERSGGGEYLEAVYKTMGEGIFSVGEDGSIEQASEKAERAFGHDKGGMEGLEFASLFTEPHRHEIADLLAAELNERSFQHVLERRDVGARRKDGSSFPATLRIGCMRGADGRHCFIAVVRDRSRERELRRKAFLAESEERRRIAADLHDSVGGQLTGIQIAVSLLRDDLKDESSTHAEAAAKILEHLETLHAMIREVTQGLEPVAADPLGLMSALARMVERLGKLHPIEISLDCEGEVLVDDHGTAKALYHIAEEAAQNAALHAQAEHVVVELKKRGDDVLLRVIDDGAGMPHEAARGNGMGLQGMIQRAEMVGAELRIEAAEPGTIVSCKAARSHV
jgi:PAS domain S-box-containing protein